LGASFVYYRRCIKPPKKLLVFYIVDLEKWIATLASSTQHPGTLVMMNGLEPTPKMVPRMEPTSTYRTLGVYLSPSGDMADSFNRLKEKTIEYASAIIGSRLSWERPTGHTSYTLSQRLITSCHF